MNCVLRNFIICVCFWATQTSLHEFYGRRSKRTLTFIPPGGVIQMIMGVGLPLVLREESVLIGMVLKGGYHLPDNSTIFTHPTVEYLRKRRSLSLRWDLYETLAHASEIHGFGGKECVLRTICELADNPLDDEKSVIEELIHVVFTPSSTNELTPDNSNTIYHAAERLGKQARGNCNVIFPYCRINFVEIFTRLNQH